MSGMCPRCRRPTLVERNREGVALDVCENCQGLWLDRGELEVLLAQSRRRSPPITVVVGEGSRPRPGWIDFLWNLFGRPAKYGTLRAA